MRKRRKSITKVLLVTIVLTASTSITSWAMTAEEVTAKNPTSYTAGTQSVYGPSLNQDQLGAVAQATADFMTNNITDSMSTDDKIKAAYDYIKNRTTYVNWDAVIGANTAYTLVTGQGACSGMCRSMKALCDAMGIECYHVHSTSNSHQWNLVRYGDGILYHVDIDANKSAGQDIIYKSLTHPLPFDTSAYPAVGQAQEQTQANGWKEENGKWFYYENGAKAVNKWIDGLYYVGPDGAMLVNTTTPDGYQVGADGAWMQTQDTTPQPTDGQHTMRASDKGIHGDCFIGVDDNHEVMMVEGMECVLLNKEDFTFKFPSDKNSITPSGHEIWVVGYVFYNGMPFAIGEPKRYPLEYDKEFTLDYTGKYSTADSFYDYCKREDLLIEVNIVDNEGFGKSLETGQGNAISWYMKYK